MSRASPQTNGSSTGAGAETWLSVSMYRRLEAPVEAGRVVRFAATDAEVRGLRRARRRTASRRDTDALDRHAVRLRDPPRVAAIAYRCRSQVRPGPVGERDACGTRRRRGPRTRVAAPRLGRRAVVEAQLDRTLPGAVDDAGSACDPIPRPRWLGADHDLGEHEAFAASSCVQKPPDDESAYEDHFPDTSWQANRYPARCRSNGAATGARPWDRRTRRRPSVRAGTGDEDRAARSRVVQTLRPRDTPLLEPARLASSSLGVSRNARRLRRLDTQSRPPVHAPAGTAILIAEQLRRTADIGTAGSEHEPDHRTARRGASSVPDRPAGGSRTWRRGRGHHASRGTASGFGDVGMLDDRAHDRRAEAAAAVLGQHVDIAQPRPRRQVGDHAGEADLLAAPTCRRRRPARCARSHGCCTSSGRPCAQYDSSDMKRWTATTSTPLPGRC